MKLLVNMRKSDTKDLIESCVNFYAKELNIKDSNFALIVNSRKGLMKNADCRGVAYVVAGRIFGLDIDSKLTVETLIEVLAHEMVHIKQFARGQVKYKGRSMYWLGKKVVKSKINYFDQPWEHDAWAKERILASKIFKILRKEDVKFNKKNKT